MVIYTKFFKFSVYIPAAVKKYYAYTLYLTEFIRTVIKLIRY